MINNKSTRKDFIEPENISNYDTIDENNKENDSLSEEEKS